MRYSPSCCPTRHSTRMYAVPAASVATSTGDKTALTALWCAPSVFANAAFMFLAGNGIFIGAIILYWVSLFYYYDDGERKKEEAAAVPPRVREEQRIRGLLASLERGGFTMDEQEKLRKLVERSPVGREILREQAEEEEAERKQKLAKSGDSEA